MAHDPDQRDNFGKAFAGFDFHTIAGYDEGDVGRLLADPGIVRHRGKIEAVVNNARRAVEMENEEGSLAAFFWRYEPSPGRGGSGSDRVDLPESVAMSKDLKKRGWRFVGPTTAFAFVQAMGS